MKKTKSGCQALAIAMMVMAMAAASGCATQSPVKEQSFAQQVANATTRADHEKLATWYEGAATSARVQAEIHRQALQEYQRVYGNPASAHHVTLGAFTQRCLSAIRANEQLEADDMSLAQLHHDLAAKATQ